MRKRRITLFAGHYGSGKTNLAVNYALMRRLEGNKVTIADLDIVNPYFRTKDSKAELVSAGIRVISSIYANSNLDIPALPKEIYGCIENKDFLAVLDIGGDDRGAYALGRYAPGIAFLYKAGSNSGTTWICWECPSSEADPALLRSVLEAGRHIAEKKTGLPDNGPMHAVFHQYHKKSCHSCSSSL